MNRSPYEPTNAPLLDHREHEVGWRRALAVWWSAAWRGALYTVPGGFVFGALGGLLASIIGVPEQASIYGAVGGYLASIPLSMLAMKQALTKHLASLVAERRQDVA
jgi:hypothetical protein